MKSKQAKFGYWLYKKLGLRVLLLYSRLVPIETLVSIIGKVMLDVEYSNGFFKDIKFHGLFRGRSHNHPNGTKRKGELHLFTNENDFKSPPLDYVRRGRCNDHNESMFYASNELLTALVESRPKVGEYVSVASFVSLQNGKLYEHRISPVGYRYLRQLPTLKDMMKSMKPSEREMFSKADDFLDSLFHKKIKKRAYYYKLSNAVARCLLKDITNDIGTIIRQHGLIYSSILRNHRSFNVVLRPIYMMYYKIDFIQTFKILDLSQEQISLELIRQGFLEGEKRDPADNFDIRWEEVGPIPQRFQSYELN